MTDIGMITLIIKGTAADARIAADARGIPVEIMNIEHDYPSEVHAQTTDQYEAKVIAWFAEPDDEAIDNDGPFPAGTLLHYRLPGAT